MNKKMLFFIQVDNKYYLFNDNNVTKSENNKSENIF